MPRKHKDENVVNFPTTRQPKDIEKKIEEGTPTVVQKLDENRSLGVKRLEGKCDNFEHREHVTKDNPVNENILRDVEGAIKATSMALGAINSLVDMLRHDLIGSIQNIEAQAMSGWQTSAHVQVLLEVLKENGAITEEQMKTTWEKIIPEQVRKMQEQQRGPKK